MFRRRWVWSIGGMILTGQNRITSRKTCPSAVLSKKKSHMDWGLERITVYFETIFSNIRNSTAFWIIPRYRPFVLLVRGTCTWRRVWSTGGMILTEDNRINWIKKNGLVLHSTSKVSERLVRNWKRASVVTGRILTTWNHGTICEVWNKLANI